ncbi:MAG: M28 family peptidase [candidate division NC10 bacterium]|nr:M28 family peptidase [candidate division NC10 bacterium]
MWTYVAILVGLLLLSVIGYRVMIDVKPTITRPTMDEAARAEIEGLERRLMGHVRALGGTIGERNLHRPQALREAAHYIRRIWTQQGFPVTEEVYEVGGQSSANLVVEQKGSGKPGRIVLVGAHYDSLIGTPGANDNATGVALLLEMSRAFRQEPPARTVRFVAFVNEEPPYFLTGQMGSRVHARQARRRGEEILAMLSLETIGYYSNARGTQRYPFPFGLAYPSTGNFLAVVGNLPSRPLVVDFLRHFMATSDFPVEGVATFEWIPGINWSDHWSFWKEGYPALMLTDTAPYRYPEYHSRFDLPERINPREFSRAAQGIIHAVRRLATAP